MTGTHKLTFSAHGDREIRMVRKFNASAELVWQALTVPDLVKRWMSGMPGWELAICDIDLVVGGRYRYLWRCLPGGSHPGMEMGMGGAYLEIERPIRLVHTERFDQAWYPGEAVITTDLTEHGGVTTMTATIKYESREARDGVLASPAESGVAMSYDRLEALLASQTSATGS
ncbi:MAG: SRPBCC family protein [Chloroflexota bacterium]